MEPIVFINRKTKAIIKEKTPGAGFLNFLYSHPLGKLSLNLLFKRKLVSAVGGWYMNSKKSATRVNKFIEDHKMDMGAYLVPKEGFKTFNDFFYRKLATGARPIEKDLVCPADGKVLVFEKMEASQVFFVKGGLFNLKSFLNSTELAQKYEGGGMMIIRLAPTDYHRYHFPCAGLPGQSIPISGDYLSVSPLALRKSLDIFLKNKREYMVLKSPKYGDVLICDVGATMVGTIIQTYSPGSIVKKGEEKGYFAFGGSTLVILTEKDKVTFSKDLLENTKKGMETEVKMGEKIGVENPIREQKQA